MNKEIKIILVSLMIFISFSSYAQVPDSIYYNRLYYVCKAWGHVKYLHTETANGNVNWDDSLIQYVSGFRNAPDKNAFNDSLLLLLTSAGDMGISTVPLPEIPDSLNNNNDFSWIQDTIFTEPVRAILDTIRVRFRPQRNVYVDEEWVGGKPVFKTDSLYYSGLDYPSEELRILAMFRYWNIIHYFYPYKSIMDQNWDTTLVEVIPQIIESADALSYSLALKKISIKINDSHAFFFSPSYYDKIIGFFSPPFLARFIENEMVITKVLQQTTEVRVGDIIKEIDGEDIYSLRDSLRAYAYGSNDVIVERDINTTILRGDLGNFLITVDNGSSTHTEELVRNYKNRKEIYSDTGPIWRDTTVNGNCLFGIVDMGRLEISDVSTMFNDLWNTDAIIFDIRNYPRGTLFDIVDYLYPTSIHIANFTYPDITYPGALNWGEEYIGKGTAYPYRGRVIILFDERTQSHAEYTCMGLEQFPNSIKIGSTTAAADGNIAIIYLPGNIYTYATFLGTFYPNYTPTQRIGIIPDFEVHPTISGIRAGLDEVMDSALNCDFIEIKKTETLDNLKLYPNPVKEKIYYYFEDKNEYLLEIFDMCGRKLKSVKIYRPSGIIDISNLKSGAYIFKLLTNKNITEKIIIMN